METFTKIAEIQCVQFVGLFGMKTITFSKTNINTSPPQIDVCLKINCLVVCDLFGNHKRIRIRQQKRQSFRVTINGMEKTRRKHKRPSYTRQWKQQYAWYPGGIRTLWKRVIRQSSSKWNVVIDSPALKVQIITK